MNREITRQAEQEEAIDAHSGFRVRVVTRWDSAARGFRVEVHLRGSETEEEVSVDTGNVSFALLQDAQEHGFSVATRWIDRQAS